MVIAYGQGQEKFMNNKQGRGWEKTACLLISNTLPGGTGKKGGTNGSVSVIKLI